MDWAEIPILGSRLSSAADSPGSPAQHVLKSCRVFPEVTFEVLSDAKGPSLLQRIRPHARAAHCPHMASHFSRAQSGMNSLLTTYGKGDLLPRELFLSSSFPETWMDFILINDEAWALWAEKEVGGELCAWIGEGKGKNTRGC